MDTGLSAYLYRWDRNRETQLLSHPAWTSLSLKAVDQLEENRYMYRYITDIYLTYLENTCIYIYENDWMKPNSLCANQKINKMKMKNP